MRRKFLTTLTRIQTGQTAHSLSRIFQWILLVTVAAPTGLTATLVVGLQVNPSWTDNSANETCYVIERSVNGGAFTQIGTAPAFPGIGLATFLDIAVTPETTADFRVAAVNATGQSAFSNTVSVTVPAVPTAPGNFNARVGGNPTPTKRSMILTWLDLSTNETGFTIQRATNAAFTANLNSVSVAAGVQAFTQTGLSRNTTYYYRIRAINGPLVSSAWVLATPFPITTR